MGKGFSRARLKGGMFKSIYVLAHALFSLFIERLMHNVPPLTNRRLIYEQVYSAMVER
jgi:hypothetical protein